MFIYGEGTAYVLLTASTGSEYVGVMHNCLQGTGLHDLLSLSQLQILPQNICSLANSDPYLTVNNVRFALHLINGVYELPYTILTRGDSRRYRLPHLVLTPGGVFTPVSSATWTKRVISAPQLISFRKLVPVFLHKSVPSFGEALVTTTTTFYDSTVRPLDKRTFQVDVAEDLEELSIRFMGISGERLKHTMLISSGLILENTGATGASPRNIRANLFPQGNMKSNRPYIYKGQVQRLHKAGIAEAVFTDTFEVDDIAFRYGQAFVCYRSRYGRIYPIRSRTEVGRAFSRFCSDNFTPLMLIRDNIAENTGGDLLHYCLTMGVASAYICPYKPQMDFAENYLGRVCSMASYAMVYAGAPMYMWRFAILAAVFVNNLAATYYSTEKVWATPFEVIFGEAYPDTGIIMPFGCAALILLQYDDRSKFKSRCILVIFVHYAENHPHSTYAFYSPATKRILYRQDCVFLVDVFPMRTARLSAGLSKDGDILVPYKCKRPPKSVTDHAPSEFSFENWKAPVLPKFDDHITGFLENTTGEDIDIDLDPVMDKSRDTHTPDHPQFGPSSVIPVGLPRYLHPEKGAGSAQTTLPVDTEGTNDTIVPTAIGYPIEVELSSISPSPTPSPATDFNEDSAEALVGERFYDDDFGWCRVTGFGTEAGHLISFWTPEVAGAAEEWSTFAEVSVWVSHSKSRQGKRSSTRKLRKRVAKLGKLRPVLASSPISTPNPKSAHPIRPSVLRQILRFQVSIFKYGVQIPKTEAEADNSPERRQWKAGRDLEWIRLGNRGTFGESYTWAMIQEKFPHYRKCDIGTTFFVYDFKHSGEHRVRLVFNGSRQTPATYSDTFAPTVRAASIRLFHLYCVEMDYDIRQYDVPQAFLQSPMDHLIFVRPPQGYATFPGEILLLRLGLYGAKQSAAIWAKTLHTFLVNLGFRSSDLDPCFYKRREPSGEMTLLISYVDDFRIGGSEAVVQAVYEAMFKEWGITSCDGTRFLGLDVAHDRQAGKLTFSMGTYIKQAIERFEMADLSKGLPYRNLVGCLMWIACSVFGPILVKVKELARHCNAYTEKEYNLALKLLHSLDPSTGIVFLRGGAYRERVPQLSRNENDDLKVKDETASLLGEKEGGDPSPSFEGFTLQSSDIVNEFGEKDLFRVKDEMERNLRQEDKKTSGVQTTKRFRVVGYSDAAFAVDELKQSVSGWVVYLNGTPILFGSLRQTVVVDSSCSSEYVAASICVKQIMELENMLEFLEIHCEKPYRMYTDSMACKHIACNNSRLGKVRHLAIRTHLVRCHISLGDIELVWCTTESMVADVMTKIVSSAQDKRLTIRFYNDVDLPLSVIDCEPKVGDEMRKPKTKRQKGKK